MQHQEEQSLNLPPEYYPILIEYYKKVAKLLELMGKLNRKRTSEINSLNEKERDDILSTIRNVIEEMKILEGMPVLTITEGNMVRFS